MRASEEAKDLIRLALAENVPGLSMIERKYIAAQILRTLSEKGYIIHHYKSLKVQIEDQKEEIKLDIKE